MQVIATGTNGHGFVVETSEKVSGRIQRITVANEADGLRYCYFWSRLYITEKVISFLNQRGKAFQLANNSRVQQAAYDLATRIQTCQLVSLHSICQLVFDNEKLIEFLAPRKGSDQYKYYSNTILPILEFCREMKGKAI